MNKKQAYELSIKVLSQERQRRYASSLHAAEQGFEFGINAKKLYNKFTEAINILTEEINRMEK